jgi:pimeloyl-ACP methyl ester carboxylesterase
MNRILLYLLIFHLQLFSFSYHFTQYHIIDTSRKELYPHTNIHPYRELMMHVWIPVIEKQSPLILFSHGLGENFNGTMYTQLCQYCASFGYVVASVSHPYGCKPIKFSDNRMSPYLFPASFHYQTGKHMFDIEADIWVEDMLCALVECVRQNGLEDSLLYNAIDTSRIGIMGHSLGGAAAMQVARRDDRIKAVINLEGPLYGTHAREIIDVPLMVILGSLKAAKQIAIPVYSALLWRLHFDQSCLPQLNAFIASLPNDVYKITIDGIIHETFSDLIYHQDPILEKWLIKEDVAQEIIHSYVGAFFNYYLKGITSPLLEMNSPCSNVTIEKRITNRFQNIECQK